MFPDELAPWRLKRHKISGVCVTKYLKQLGASEPKENFDDRNALYCIRFNLLSSALYPGELKYCTITKEEMTEFVMKLSRKVQPTKM